ncbi:MAG TPA: response regulator [Vicinamibacterales bacterium]|nr:response regulator [Vicinamibacterales bacterium]
MSVSPSRILVVDDDPAGQHETIKLLQRRDYEVMCAWSLEDAYARLTQVPYDLVIAGSRVGSMSGLQFIVGCRARRPEVAGIIVATQREHVSEMDAWRHGITPVFRPLEADHFLMLVAEKLASIRRRQRWPRKRINSYIPLQVGHARARLLDVSYGGLRFELEGESFDLRSPVHIDIPASHLSVDAELVWSARATDGASCLCGVMLSGSRVPAHAWRAFVDRVS